MPIPNPNPLQMQTADKLWVVALRVARGQIVATLAPWDGQFLAGGPSQWRTVRATLADDAGARGAWAPVAAALSRLAGRQDAPEMVSVQAARPGARASVLARWADGGQYIIGDMFAAVAGDAALAAAYGAAMAWIAEEVR